MAVLTIRLARVIPVDKTVVRQLAKSLNDDLLREFKLASRQTKNLAKSLRDIRSVWLQDETEVTDVRGLEKAVKIVFRVLPGRDSTLMTSAAVGTTSHGPVLVVDLSGGWTLEEALDAMSFRHGVDARLYDLLLHEITHLIDVLRKPEYASQHGDVSDEKAYYNDPAEVRAYMQTVVDEISYHKDRLAKLLKVFGPQKGMQMILNLSKTWVQISPIWTPSNKKKVIKSVYQFMGSTGALDG